jgi:hypothetical protein
MVLNKIMDKLKASLDAPIGSLLPEADTQIIQRTGWYQVVTPSVKEVSVNEVIFSLVDPAEVETRVNEAFEIYRRHGLPFKWCIGPMSSPEIEPRIGPVASASWLFRGMAIDTAREVTLPDGIAVERVDGENFDEFLTVFIQGWFTGNSRSCSCRARGTGTISPGERASRWELQERSSNQVTAILAAASSLRSIVVPVAIALWWEQGSGISRMRSFRSR